MHGWGRGVWGGGGMLIGRGTTNHRLAKTINSGKQAASVTGDNYFAGGSPMPVCDGGCKHVGPTNAGGRATPCRTHGWGKSCGCRRAGCVFAEADGKGPQGGAPHGVVVRRALMGCAPAGRRGTCPAGGCAISVCVCIMLMYGARLLLVWRLWLLPSSVIVVGGVCRGIVVVVGCGAYR